MTIIFQIIAVAVIAVAAFLLFRGGGERSQAIRRALMLLFIAAAASSVFFPQMWTWMANKVGIGRGADLLLYLLVLIFMGYVVSTHRSFRQIDRKITALARVMALSEATVSSTADVPSAINSQKTPSTPETPASPPPGKRKGAAKKPASGTESSPR